MSSVHARCGSACVLGAPRPFTFVGTSRVYERSRPFAVRHLALDFDISDVAFVDKKSARAKFVYDGNTLSVPIGRERKRARIRIAYRAKPKRGLYFLEPDEHVQDRPRQVWTQCQDEDARHWFPCHDKPHLKMTFELVARIPKG